jgi:hypothetical protein
MPCWSLFSGDDASAKCSGSSRRAPHSAFSACMRPSTTPSTSNAISSHAPRCGSSEPRQPTNGATRSRQCDCLLCFTPFSLANVNLTMRLVYVRNIAAAITTHWRIAATSNLTSTFTQRLRQGPHRTNKASFMSASPHRWHSRTAAGGPTSSRDRKSFPFGLPPLGHRLRRISSAIR